MARSDLGQNDFESWCKNNNQFSLLEEWDYDLNAPVLPNNVTRGSSIKLWWKCSKGHEWQTSPNSRTNPAIRSGCPFCSGLRTIPGVNDIATTKPELLKYWDFQRNSSIDLSTISAGSCKTVWWICDNKHNWKAKISDVSKGNGCPYCSGHQVWVGYNDLAFLRPDLAAEWDYQKNQSAKNGKGQIINTPQSVTIKSNQKVWWRCAKGHSWQATVNSRTSRNDSCPFCSGRRVLQGFNDLATTNPELLNEWNYERNDIIIPNGISSGSHRKVWWKCSRGHEWQAPIYSRVNNHGCPLCAGKGSSMPEQGLAYYLERVTPVSQRIKIHKKECDIFLPQFNIGIEYDGGYHHRNKVEADEEKNIVFKNEGLCFFRICGGADKNEVIGHRIYCTDGSLGPNFDWALSVLFGELSEITSNMDFYSCDINSLRDSLEIRKRFDLYEKNNSLAVKHPELAREWNYEKNGVLTPEMFFSGSDKKVWWKCKYGHEWQANINNRVSGNGCLYCSKLRTLTGVNDLATANPLLAEEWNYEKNIGLKDRWGNDISTPDKVTLSSDRKVWWRCSTGHEWQATVYGRSIGHSCPYCSGHQVWSGFNDLVTLRPDLMKEWNFNKNEGLEPNKIAVSCSKKVWWRCSEGHEWQATLNHRSKGQGCPFCCGKRVLAGYNDLATKRPKLVLEWNYEKNMPLRPEEVSVGSEKKVWWKCSQGHEWKASINNRSSGRGCPYCSGRRVKKT